MMISHDIKNTSNRIDNSDDEDSISSDMFFYSEELTPTTTTVGMGRQSSSRNLNDDDRAKQSPTSVMDNMNLSPRRASSIPHANLKDRIEHKISHYNKEELHYQSCSSIQVLEDEQEELKERMQIAHKWFLRMGRPKRKSMIQLVEKNPSSYDNLTEKEIQLLPWNDSGTFMNDRDIYKNLLGSFKADVEPFLKKYDDTNKSLSSNSSPENSRKERRSTDNKERNSVSKDKERASRRKKEEQPQQERSKEEEQEERMLKIKEQQQRLQKLRNKNRKEAEKKDKRALRGEESFIGLSDAGDQQEQEQQNGERKTSTLDDAEEGLMKQCTNTTNNSQSRNSRRSSPISKSSNSKSRTSPPNSKSKLKCNATDASSLVSGVTLDEPSSTQLPNPSTSATNDKNQQRRTSSKGITSSEEVSPPVKTAPRMLKLPLRKSDRDTPAYHSPTTSNSSSSSKTRSKNASNIFKPPNLDSSPSKKSSKTPSSTSSSLRSAFSSSRRNSGMSSKSMLKNRLLTDSGSNHDSFSSIGSRSNHLNEVIDEAIQLANSQEETDCHNDKNEEKKDDNIHSRSGARASDRSSRNRRKKTSNANNDSRKNNNNKKSVGFDQVDVRLYERILGDNPSCAPTGPSISLGWRYKKFVTMDIDDWEQLRSNRSTKMMHSIYYQKEINTFLVLTGRERISIALDFGFSEADIENNVLKMRIAQEQRARQNLRDKQAAQYNRKRTEQQGGELLEEDSEEESEASEVSFPSEHNNTIMDKRKYDEEFGDEDGQHEEDDVYIYTDGDDDIIHRQ